MRLLHLSDLHINPNYHKINIEKTEFVISNAIRSGFDHIIITGDITHDADKQSFLVFRNILKKYNLLDSKKATITIGNHDIFGGVYSVKDLINFPDRCKAVNYEAKVLSFLSYFEELFVDCIFPSSNIFPFYKIVDDLILVGVNTNDIYSVVKNPLASNGKVAQREFEDLEKIFSMPQVKEKRKIILAHHHFYKNNYGAKSSTNELWNKIEGFTLKLRGKKKLIKLFRKNKVDLVLHGHSHENKHYQRMGIDFFNSAGSIDNSSNSHVIKCILDINSKDIEIKQEALSLEQTNHITLVENICTT
jgi:3',5'-cyclic AMP phosphodiesterase CpdA